jgi:hypothetical protein
VEGCRPEESRRDAVIRETKLPWVLKPVLATIGVADRTRRVQDRPPVALPVNPRLYARPMRRTKCFLSNGSRTADAIPPEKAITLAFRAG